MMLSSHSWKTVKIRYGSYLKINQIKESHISSSKIIEPATPNRRVYTIYYIRCKYKKSVESVLSLAPQCKGSGIAQVVETSNAESPTPVYVYRKHS